MRAPTALRVYEHQAIVYRRTFRGTIASSFLNPILYLTAMGIGLGGYVDRSGQATNALAGLSYLTFLAPGLLAAVAMQTAGGESTWAVLGAIKWQKTYLAMLATPISVRDLVVGHLSWVATRLLIVTTIFLAIMVVFGATRGPEAILSVPAAVLTGLAFAAPISAFAATQENDSGFNAVFRFGIIPLFLFSGTFFPISQLPAFLQPLAWATPLWHGVELCRGLALGTIDPLGFAVHTGYLLVVAGLGCAAALWAYQRRLAQ
ncbi:MAG TPA: ABC transporter permease [Candidatus Limnocylindrales bacterium]|nr:ABC transporter permease [Candidatus Limnocylindrales bacterium]